MDRNTDAAAHDDPVQQRDIRLRNVFDGCVEAVLVAVETKGSGRLLLTGIIEQANVAAGTESTLPHAANCDRSDCLVANPFFEPGLHNDAHLASERVQSLGSIESNQSQSAAMPEQNAIRHCRNISRPTITRMISLVPSRIWWTRRSRTWRSA